MTSSERTSARSASANVLARHLMGGDRAVSGPARGRSRR